MKYTTVIFIMKARKVHGNKYDYSKVKYIDSQTKVCIICPIHGEFWQKPSSHLSGKGCEKCIRKVWDTDSFITEAIKIHGNKYDYSKVKYIKSQIKVCIICPIHGEFWITPNNHLSGKGCLLCNQSHLEQKIEHILIENNINYIFQKEFNWLVYQNKLKLDFYLPDYNIDR